MLHFLLRTTTNDTRRCVQLPRLNPLTRKGVWCDASLGLHSHVPRPYLYEKERKKLPVTGFHTEGWGPWNLPPETLRLLLWLVCVVCPRLRHKQSEIFPGLGRGGGWDMPPDPPSSHARLRILLSSCYHPVPPHPPPQLKIMIISFVTSKYFVTQKQDSPFHTVWQAHAVWA